MRVETEYVFHVIHLTETNFILIKNVIKYFISFALNISDDVDIFG